MASPSFCAPEGRAIPNLTGGSDPEEIVEEEQGGAARAAYGEGLLADLAERLTRSHGKGFTESSLRQMRQFFLLYPGGSALVSSEPAAIRAEPRHELPDRTDGRDSSGDTPTAPASSQPLPIRAEPRHESRSLAGPRPIPVGLFPPSLSWTHYRILLRVLDPISRSFYEIEAAREAWSTTSLERQIASPLFERLAASRDKEAVLALGRKGLEVSKPSDVIKDPLVLEFLDLPERPGWLERDLETAIMDRLQDFLLELGKGFTFVARQKRITLDGDHFYVDLVFYNRLLRAFVLVDLQLGKIAHQDLGQMQMYVNWYDRVERAEGEEPTVCIVLCSDKNDAMVRVTLPEDSRIVAARYQRYLPTEDELRVAVIEERRRLEVAFSTRMED